MAKLIVEVCQNHNGSRESIREMVKTAAENGADMVKMQSIWSADVTARERFEEGEGAIKRPYAAEVARLSKLDLSLDDHQFFIDTCRDFNVIPFTTIFARGRIKEVAALPWPGRWIKVASYDCASYPMLYELAAHFDNFVISTGATFDEEIVKTAELMKRLGKRFIFLHCVTSYPNTLAMCNLSRIEWLRQFTSEVGWSDHTKVADDGIAAAKVALMLGADYVERHFTILPADQTKDGPVSITPALLKELSEFRHLPPAVQRVQVEKEIPEWQTLIGTPTRELTHTELQNRDYYRGRFASPNGKGGRINNWEENQ